MTPAALESFKELQRQLNRARSALNKPTISIDGRLGPGTVSAGNDTSRSINALGGAEAGIFAQAGALQVFDTCDDLSAAALAGDYTRQLKAFADAKNVSAIVNAPTTSPPTTSSGNTIVNPSDKLIRSTACGPNLGFFDGLKCKFRMMPTWQQVGVGAIGGLAMLFVVNKVTKKKTSSSPGTAGYRRR